jgi:RNA-dependent RNA polymerase
VCFELLTPPILEEMNFHRERTGVDWRDNHKFRRRVSELNPCHGSVAPYAHHLRILLFDGDARSDVLTTFLGLCKTANLRAPLVQTKLEASRAQPFFSPQRLAAVRKWLKDMDWDLAFQLELLLHNGLLTTSDLLCELKQPIDDLRRDHRSVAASVLKHFAQALRMRSPGETPRQCMVRVYAQRISQAVPTLAEGMFWCHHVTITPTRFVLEGPTAIQSNRVIREYKGFEDNFLRVDFRDEDRLQLRWDREVDGTLFLQKRVGDILKTGFELANRRFEFLAYSSSALRGHAVWFMTPFEHDKDGLHVEVSSESIRRGRGLFHKTNLIYQPSKYAARLAQAFTATDPSVRIRRDQWDEDLPDIGPEKQPFTDGCGTISPDLADQIWEALLRKQDHKTRKLRPVVSPMT